MQETRQNEITHIYPANSLQQGFIYHALSQPEDDAYRVQLIYDYHQSLDLDLYIKAWEACIEQYPILRTAFNWEEEIIQIIYKRGKLDYEVHDISDLPTQHARNERIETIQREDRKRSFDLTKPSLFRLHIIKQSEDLYTVLRTEHHSISDGWSGPILLANLHRYYHGLQANKRITIREDTSYISAQDYISNNRSKLEDYWKEALSEVDTANDINPLLTEPIDFNKYRRVGQPSSASFEIKGIMYDKLKSLSQREGVTLNVVLQFIWHKLLQVYCRSSRSVVGTTVSGRDLPVEGIEESVGLYINTLPLVIDWEQNNTILSQLHQIQERIIEINSRHYIDLTKLQKGGKRIFHSLFVFENYPVSQSSGVDFPKFSIRDVIDKVDYPLCMVVYEQKESIAINLKFDANHLTKERVRDHMETLSHILDQVIKNPGKPHGEISLLRPAEYNQIIYDWNQTEKNFPADKTIHQLFEEQVIKTPDNIALVFEDQKLTYRQLNQKSNQLARHIRDQYEVRTKKTLVPDTLITICLDRSLEMVIGILGILKAGGAYVPVDPSYPKHRTDYLLADTKSELIVSQRHLIQGSTLLPREKVIYIDLWEKFYRTEDPSNLKPCNSASDLVYVIYTSGTTGKPKGVMLEHASICNRVFHIISYSNISASDYHLFKTNYTFDASFFEIFSNLCVGAKLQLTTYGFDLDELSHLLSNNNFTSLHLVPSQYELVSSLINSINLHKIYFSGEALTPNIVSDIDKNIKIYNFYGPTELGEITGSNPLTPADARLIGRVFPNCSQYVLDNNLIPVPIGVRGELYIGGIGVARGYLNRENLTAKRFIPNPFATDKDKEKSYNRLYKTGDLVRSLPDGNLEFIGRNDDQVKIQGYRVELGEVEHALIQIPGINQSCVMVRETETVLGSTKYLVGYYVSSGDRKTMTPSTILEMLSAVLPKFMLPSALTEMPSFPLTVNGKVDKQALPDPQFVSSEEYVAPITKTEKETCLIWQQILGLEEVGITDDFFQIGGNSIQAIRVAHQMNKILGFDVRVADLFKCKTVSQLLALSTGQTQLVIPKTSSNEEVLSFAQERLWFIEQYEESTHAYHLPLVFNLDSEIDVEGVIYAIQQIVSRHEVLRSTIEQSIAHGGIQVVHNKPAPVQTLSIPASDDYISLISADISRPFDLKREYPIRVKFYRLLRAKNTSENEVDRILLSINIHHIAGDAWSNVIFQRELLAYYEAYVNIDPKFSLPALEIQYKDYALWQRQHLSGKILDQQLNYWKRKLMGYQNLELPTDYPRTKQSDYRGAFQEFALSEKTSKKLRALAQYHRVTLHSVLLSSINILLAKFTGQQDIVIGSPIANRHYRQTEGLIGCFVNTQVHRTILDKFQSFEDLIQQVHQDQIKAQKYQDLPFEKLVEEMRVQRDSSRHPIFQVMFGLQSGIEDSTSINRQRVYFKPFLEAVNYDVEKFDLSISIDDRRDELKGIISYATRLFHRDTIVRLIDHYTYLLELLLESPQIAFSKLSLLCPHDYNRIVYQWNETDKDFPRNKTIYQLFEEQVNKTPDHIALVFGKVKLTFRELNEKSNQLARHIRAQYLERTNQVLKPDTLIALYLDRSLEMVIGILGVLKAGFAYVPVDPSYPKKRIEYLLRDTKAAFILSQKHLKPTSSILLPDNDIVYIDLSEDLYKLEAASNLEPHSCASDLAYVIYTSGTTGKPKGVMIEHRSVINLIEDLKEKYGVAPSEKFLLFTNYVFDASIEQWSLSLLSGGILYLIDNRSIIDNRDLIEFIVDNQITHFHSTPSHLSTIEPKKISNLQRVVFGAEFLSKDLFEKYKKVIPKVINEYGPTETTITSLISINSPVLNNVRIQNIKIFVADHNIVPVPIGVIGELYITGECLARGYLNRDDLSSQSFIPNPFATDKDRLKGFTRLYKTGDLVRWLSDGSLEFIGRNDDQVKIRGYRIELGEISSALAKVPGIIQSCVLVRERNAELGSNKYLVGYYVLNNGQEPISQAQILKQLSAVLPNYMLPSALVQMPSFPLTINGKLDKRAFPDPQLGHSKEYVAPVTEAETDTCRIWQQILGLDRVGVTDDFFRVGGNSIQAIQVSHQMSKVLGWDVRVADIFKCKTPSRLLAHNMAKTQIIIAKASENPATLSFAQERLWFIEQYEEGTNAYHIPEILELEKNTEIPGLKYAIQQIVGRHEVLRSTIDHSNDHGGIQVVHNAPLLFEEESILASDDFDALIRRDISRPFDLKTEYPIRVKFYRILSAKAELGKKLDKTILFINTHHIASDAWSNTIFHRELLSYYKAYIDNDLDFTLPDLEIQYRDYALWHRHYITGEILDQQLNYWKNKLMDYQNLELPTDYPRPNETEYQGAYQDFTLRKETSEKLHALARHYRVTLHSVLLSSINILLGKITGQKDIVIGSPIANRHHRQTEGLIGFFVNTQVNRTLIADTQSFEDLIHRVHQDQIEAQVHQDLPFETLVEKMQVQRDTSRHSIFQVMFVLRNLTFDKTFDQRKKYFKPFLSSSIYQVEKFDLSFFINDNHGELDGGVSYATSLFHHGHHIQVGRSVHQFTGSTG